MMRKRMHLVHTMMPPILGYGNTTRNISNYYRQILLMYWRMSKFK